MSVFLSLLSPLLGGKGHLPISSWQILEYDREIVKSVLFPMWFFRNGVGRGIGNVTYTAVALARIYAVITSNI